MNRIITLFLFLYFSTNVIAQDEKGIAFLNDMNAVVDLDSLFKISKEENKLIFLYFYAPNCDACDWIAKSFRNRSIGKLYNKHYLSYALDAQGLGNKMASNLGIIGYPTLMYLTPKGEIKFSARGYRDGQSIFDIGQLARLPSRTIKRTMHSKYKSNPNDTNHLFDYIEYQFVRGKYSKVEKLLKEYLDQRDKIVKEAWMNLVLDFASDSESYANEVLIKEKELFSAEFGEKFINEIIWNSLMSKVSQKIDNREISEFEKKFIEETIKAGYEPTDDALIIFYSDYLCENHMFIQSEIPSKDEYILTKYALAAMDIKDHTFNQAHLMALSIHIIANHPEEDALIKLFEALDANFKKTPHYNYLDLQSVVLYAQGKEERAVQKIVEARELAMSQGEINYKPRVTLFKKLGIVK